MKTELLHRIRQQLIVFGVLFVILVGAFIAWRIVPFRMTGTTPGLNKTSILDSKITINFNHELNTTETKVNKADFIAAYAVKDKSVIVSFQNVVVNKSYTITIPQATDSSGRTLKNIKITFTARDKSLNDLPKKEQEQALQQQQENKSPNVTDSVLKYVPYATLDYRIEPVTDNGKTTLHIQLLLAPNTPDGEKDADIAQYKSEARTYLSGRGINIDDYPVTYEVVQEELTGH